MSRFYEILTAVQSLVVDLALEDVDAANVVVMKVPAARGGLLPELPGVVIAPGEGPRLEVATAAADDLVYPVQVATVQAGNQDGATKLDRALRWREDLTDAVRHQRLATVDSVYDCQVEPLPAFETAAWLAQYDVSGLLLNFRSREVR